jgi:hypothetical protein
MTKQLKAIRKLAPNECVRVSEAFDETIDIATAAARTAASIEQERIAAGKSEASPPGVIRAIRVGSFARDAIRQRRESE